jgi:hypothetical protein
MAQKDTRGNKQPKNATNIVELREIEFLLYKQIALKISSPSDSWYKKV